MIGIFKIGSNNGWKTYDLVDLRKDNDIVTEYEMQAFAIFRFTGTWAETDYNLKKLLYCGDSGGKFPWDKGYRNDLLRQRTFCVDFERLGLDAVTLAKLYDKNTKVDIKDLGVSIESVLKNKETYSFKDPSKLLLSGSIAQGYPTIGGGGATYANITTFQADIAAQQDEELIAKHNPVQTAITSVVTFNHDTNNFVFGIEAASGAEYPMNGLVTGARIDFGTFDEIKIQGVNMKKVKFAHMLLTMGGNGNRGLNFNQGGDSGTGTNIVDSMYFNGNTDSFNPIITGSSWEDLDVYNCMIRNADGYNGIHLTMGSASQVQRAFNNTIVNCYNGINVANVTGVATIVNNLCQDNVGGNDFAGTERYDNSSKNISKDGSSPQAALRNKDKTGKFYDYGAGNLHLFEVDSDIRPGTDVSAVFTTDCDNETRTYFDVGADEFIPVPGGGGIGCCTKRWWS